MSRPLRDRVGEALRQCRLGNVGGGFERQSDSVKDDYRKSADWFIANASSLGFRITDEREQHHEPRP